MDGWMGRFRGCFRDAILGNRPLYLVFVLVLVDPFALQGNLTVSNPHPHIMRLFHAPEDYIISCLTCS